MKASKLTINVADRVRSTRAEGPGIRYAIWVQGCPMRCPGCCNPEMLEFRSATQLSVDTLFADIMATPEVEGVTFLGGEPFSQAAELAALAARVRAQERSVMVFTGWTRIQIESAGRADWAELLANTDLLVDGPYLENQAVTDRRWIGSTNQEVHFLSDRYRDLQLSPVGWDGGRNTVEIRLIDGEIQVNGFPHGSHEIKFSRDFSRDNE